MNDMAIKFCGITRLEDALAAIECGATMLGFNFYPPSPRYLNEQDCAHLVEALLPYLEGRLGRVRLVGVFVNTPPEAVLRRLDACGLDLAQLSGDESPADLAALGSRAFKVLRARPGQSLLDLAACFPTSDRPPAWLVDAHAPGLYGGAGKLADWDQARQLARRAPILLAGGLHPGNVAEAVAQVQPWGVDVASGIEAEPGIKDRRKMAQFIQQVQVQRTSEVHCT